MMNVRDPAVDSALDKWRTQWPGWTFAEPFVPMLHRERAIAWLALRGELMAAAWGGEGTCSSISMQVIASNAPGMSSAMVSAATWR